MILVQITDTHILAEDDTAPDDAAAKDVRMAAFRRVIADINALDPQPDVVIHTGDLTHYGSPSQFALARSVLAELRAPWYVSPGNRDGRDGFIEAFSQDGPLKPDARFSQYAVEGFPVRLIAADSITVGTNTGEFCKDRYDHLHELLAENEATPTALFLHHPPFPIVESNRPYAYDYPDDYDAFARFIARHPQICRIFCGHAHRAAFDEISGVPVSTMPSVAVDLRMGTYEDDLADVPIYFVHTFDGENGFSTESRVAQ